MRNALFSQMSVRYLPLPTHPMHPPNDYNDIKHKPFINTVFKLVPFSTNKYHTRDNLIMNYYYAFYSYLSS